MTLSGHATLPLSSTNVVVGSTGAARPEPLSKGLLSPANVPSGVQSKQDSPAGAEDNSGGGSQPPYTPATPTSISTDRTGPDAVAANLRKFRETDDHEIVEEDVGLANLDNIMSRRRSPSLVSSMSSMSLTARKRQQMKSMVKEEDLVLLKEYVNNPENFVDANDSLSVAEIMATTVVPSLNYAPTPVAHAVDPMPRVPSNGSLLSFAVEPSPRDERPRGSIGAAPKVDSPSVSSNGNKGTIRYSKAGSQGLLDQSDLKDLEGMMDDAETDFESKGLQRSVSFILKPTNKKDTFLFGKEEITVVSQNGSVMVKMEEKFVSMQEFLARAKRSMNLSSASNQSHTNNNGKPSRLSNGSAASAASAKPNDARASRPMSSQQSVDDLRKLLKGDGNMEEDLNEMPDDDD